jgi:hypothetical protein
MIREGLDQGVIQFAWSLTVAIVLFLEPVAFPARWTCNQQYASVRGLTMAA